MKIALLGDIALIGNYDLSINQGAYYRLRSLKKELEKFDFVVANLESPLTSVIETLIPKSMHLRSNPINVDILKYLNIDAVTIANNHINDFGKNGIRETIKILDSNNIQWYGINGKSLRIEMEGVKISFSGYCCLSSNPTGKDVNILDYEQVTRSLEDDKKDGYRSILSFHWGREHSNYPNSEHISLVRKITSLYDVVIHGHHPHVIQPILKFNRSIVAFSLGNCIFDDMLSHNKKKIVRQNSDNKISYILGIRFVNEQTSFDTQGIIDGNLGIDTFNASEIICGYNDEFMKYVDTDDYSLKRDEKYRVTINEKFGKRNIRWFISNINYHTIFSRLLGFVKARKYAKKKKNFYR